MAQSKTTAVDALADTLRSQIVNWSSFYADGDQTGGERRLLSSLLFATSGKRIRYLSLDIDFVSSPRRLELVAFTSKRIIKLSDHIEADADSASPENLTIEVFRRIGLLSVRIVSGQTPTALNEAGEVAIAPLSVSASYPFATLDLPLRRSNHDAQALRVLASDLIAELDA